MSRGCILVTGGCGCLGSHVIEQLLNDALFTSVHALDVNIHHKGHWSRKAKVVYHEGDVLSHQTVAALLSELKPVAIIHTASPPSVGTKGVERRMFDTNVIGTKMLLDQAEVNECRAFVYTSSVGVLEGTSFDAVDESHPILTGESRGSLYGRSKAIADQMVSVLKAGGGLHIGRVILKSLDRSEITTTLKKDFERLSSACANFMAWVQRISRSIQSIRSTLPSQNSKLETTPA